MLKPWEQIALFGEDALICDWCGEISPTMFMHELNHQEVGSRGICMSMWLTQNHKRHKESSSKI